MLVSEHRRRLHKELKSKAICRPKIDLGAQYKLNATPIFIAFLISRYNSYKHLLTNLLLSHNGVIQRSMIIRPMSQYDKSKSGSCSEEKIIRFIYLFLSL